MRRSFPGLLLVFLAAASFAADGLDRLRADPSSAASEKLVDLFDKTEDADQKFWIIHALGARLSEKGDTLALETLLSAAEKDGDGVRAPALRALAVYSSGRSAALGPDIIARLDVLARKGIQASSPSVREGAESLLEQLERRRSSSAQLAPPPPGRGLEPRGFWEPLGRALRWLWVLALPAVAFVWAAMGLPVFDAENRAGGKAREAWNRLARERLLLSGCALLWMLLSAMLAGGGFDILALALGRPLYEVGGGWTKAYYAVGLCLFLPGALLAAGLSKEDGSSRLLSCLRAVPGALVLWLIVFSVLVPLEILYRLLLRKREAQEGFTALLEKGSLRSGYLASRMIARDDMGALPALKRAGEIEVSRSADGPCIDLGAFDLRFILLCAAPILAFFCALVARGQSIQWAASWPVVLLGCGLWSWSVLAGVLYGVIQSLEGVLIAGFYEEATERSVDPWGEL